MIKAPHKSDTQKFYNDLMEGDTKRGIWGANKRFDGEKIARKESVKKYFLPIISSYISKTDTVLEIGCGPGGFTLVTSKCCKTITGLDLSERFIKAASDLGKQNSNNKMHVLVAKGDNLPFKNNTFDKVMMVDVIHHLDDVQSVLSQVNQVLKPSGKLLVFEPNKYNPLLSLLCLLDKNEWGLLKLGTKKTYKNLLNDKFIMMDFSFNGLLVGPDSKLSLAITDFLNRGLGKYLFSWLNPKIFFCAQSNK